MTEFEDALNDFANQLEGLKEIIQVMDKAFPGLADEEKTQMLVEISKILPLLRQMKVNK